MQIAHTTDGEIVTLTPSGELDETTCPQLEQCLDEHCGPGARVVLDLRTLNFMDAAGVELLHRTSARSALEGWAFAVRTTGGRDVAGRRAA